MNSSYAWWWKHLLVMDSCTSSIQDVIKRGCVVDMSFIISKQMDLEWSLDTSTMISDTVPSEHCDSTCGNKLTVIHVFFMITFKYYISRYAYHARHLLFCTVMCIWWELPVLPMEEKSGQKFIWPCLFISLLCTHKVGSQPKGLESAGSTVVYVHSVLIHGN